MATKYQKSTFFITKNRIVEITKQIQALQNFNSPPQFKIIKHETAPEFLSRTRERKAIGTVKKKTVPFFSSPTRKRMVSSARRQKSARIINC